VEKINLDEDLSLGSIVDAKNNLQSLSTIDQQLVNQSPKYTWQLGRIDSPKIHPGK